MIDLYVDGGVCGKNPSPVGGTWAWCQVENGEMIRQGSGIITPEDIGLPVVSNNFTEIYAAIRGLQSMPEDWAGTIFTDSLITLRRITKGGKFNGIPEWLRASVGALKQDRKWQAVLVKGHPSREDLERGCTMDGKPVSAWNVFCDKECNRLAMGFKRDNGNP